ncbi:MAG TPA: PaaI family thioesterase [Acidimicrobiia bacterium]|nr:PaaI family thioesterase [Acidimicrobiia bacterium]
MPDPHDFDSFLGLTVDHVSSDLVTAHLEISPRHLQPYGVVHGGVYCAVVESLASMGGASWAMEREMVGVVGVHNATDFLRSAREGVMVGRAVPVHQGRTQQIWQVEIMLEDRLLARGQVRLQNLRDAEAIGGITPRTSVT